MGNQYKKRRYAPTVYHPGKKRLPAKAGGGYHPPRPSGAPGHMAKMPFSGNITSSAGKFHTKGHDVTAYVTRSMTFSDRHGNTATAKETQCFFSWKNINGFCSDDD